MKNGKIYFKNYPDIWQSNKTLAPDAVTYHSDWSKFLTQEKVSSSQDCLQMLVMKHFNTCLQMLVMKHFNTHNVRPRDILEPLTPKTKLNDNRFYMHCVKQYLLCANQ